MYTAYFIGVYTNQFRVPLNAVGVSLGAAVVMYVVLKVLRRVQDSVGTRWWIVGLQVLGIWLTSQVFRTAFGFGPIAPERLAWVSTFVRGVLATFVFVTIIGYVAQRLQRETFKAREALELAREQQVQIIAADEDAKRQAALVLHDRVQAGLIASCLELQAFAQRLDDPQRAALQPIIGRLETMRSIDVGSAARVLSPNLVDVDLTTALEELASQYQQVVSVVVDVDPQIDLAYGVLDENLLLGAYRIVEQALLNSVKHARPTRIWITLVMQADELIVRISDDGVGITEPVKPGIGTTIMNTWARALDGQWRTEPGPMARGTTVIAVLPTNAATAEAE